MRSVRQPRTVPVRIAMCIAFTLLIALIAGCAGRLQAPPPTSPLSSMSLATPSRPAPSSTAPTPDAQPPDAEPPEAEPVVADPRVGALFLGDSDTHSCTASVLEPPQSNLILTAAHCLAQDVDTYFIPAFDTDSDSDTDADSPAWGVDSVFLDPRWVTAQDPRADLAVAHVSRADGASLQTVTPHGLRLGATTRPGQEVTVIGYAAGVGGGPSACRAPASSGVEGFPALHCGGIVGGFSGAPWITGSTVSGLIGGLDGGGCDEELSYSPPFDGAVERLVTRARSGGAGDDPPEFVDDGCG